MHINLSIVKALKAHADRGEILTPREWKILARLGPFLK